MPIPDPSPILKLHVFAIEHRCATNNALNNESTSIYVGAESAANNRAMWHCITVPYDAKYDSLMGKIFTLDLGVANA